MKIWRRSLLSLLLMFSIMVVACAPRASTSTSSASTKGKYPDEVTLGAWFYINYGCTHCHGQEGRGRELIAASGPSLVSVEFKTAFPKGEQFDGALVQMIKNGAIIEKNGVASMPAWNGILADDEIGDIVAYIRAGLPNLGMPIPSSNTGEEMYTSFACIRCHGTLGTGGIHNKAASTPEHEIIPTLGGADFKKKFGSPEKVRNVILHGRLVDQGRPGVVYMPAWGRIGTAEQIDTIVDYIWNFPG